MRAGALKSCMFLVIFGGVCAFDGLARVMRGVSCVLLMHPLGFLDVLAIATQHETAYVRILPAFLYSFRQLFSADMARD